MKFKVIAKTQSHPNSLCESVDDQDTTAQFNAISYC